MPEIHPTATIEGDVQLADDVVIGPNCVLYGPITIGSGTRLVGNVYLHGPLTMGSDNLIYPFTTIGFSPQHGKYDRTHPGQGTTIGDRNTIREQVTIHRAFEDEAPTSVADDTTLMIGVHIAHDCHIGSRCTLINLSGMAGHCTVGDDVIMGGRASLHQFVRIGRGAMIGGHAGASQDVPPYFLVTSINIASSPNLVGLRRSGMGREAVDTVRWIYKTLYRRGLPVSSAVSLMESERGDDPLVREYIEFIRTSDRGICSGVIRKARDELGSSTSVEAADAS